jgi:hypothetical protein
MTRVGDLVYFAPDLLFRDVDVDGPALPEQFARRIIGYYIRPAEECAERGHAFAAGVLLVSCIDALGRLRYGGGVGKRFKKFTTEELPSFSDPTLAGRFYDNFRNGLVHEARIKEGCQFSLDRRTTIENYRGVLLVNPRELAREVRGALTRYIATISQSREERSKFSEALKSAHAEDLDLAWT